jgi:hypothetical protein
LSSEQANARYLMSPTGHEIPGDVGEAAAVLGADPTPLTPEQVPGSLPAGGGWLIVPPDLPEALLGRLLVAVGGRRDPWTILLMVRDGDELRVLPLSPGHADTPARTAERLAAPGLDPGYVGHRRLLRELTRFRHDVNNALTSALAETQFLRMDAPEGSELATALGMVEGQIDRIRRLNAALVALRAPAS